MINMAFSTMHSFVEQINRYQINPQSVDQTQLAAKARQISHYLEIERTFEEFIKAGEFLQAQECIYERYQVIRGMISSKLAEQIPFRELREFLEELSSFPLNNFKETKRNSDANQIINKFYKIIDSLEENNTYLDLFREDASDFKKTKDIFKTICLAPIARADNFDTPPDLECFNNYLALYFQMTKHLIKNKQVDLNITLSVSERPIIFELINEYMVLHSDQYQNLTVDCAIVTGSTDLEFPNINTIDQSRELSGSLQSNFSARRMIKDDEENQTLKCRNSLRKYLSDLIDLFIEHKVDLNHKCSGNSYFSFVDNLPSFDLLQKLIKGGLDINIRCSMTHALKSQFLIEQRVETMEESEENFLGLIGHQKAGLAKDYIYSGCRSSDQTTLRKYKVFFDIRKQAEELVTKSKFAHLSVPEICRQLENKIIDQDLYDRIPFLNENNGQCLGCVIC